MLLESWLLLKFKITVAVIAAVDVVTVVAVVVVAVDVVTVVAVAVVVSSGLIEKREERKKLKVIIIRREI